MLAEFGRMSAVFVVVAGISVAPASGGNLTPPGGPVTPTMKPLDQIEPRVAINAANTPGTATAMFQITQPGSYYLTGNVACPSGQAVIEIATNNVTIDLMGFTLQGVSGSLHGILTSSSYGNLAIRNGTVTGFGGNGIDLLFGGSGGIGSLIENIQASRNSNGIVPTAHAIVRQCTATVNFGIGIDGEGQCVIESCTSAYNSSGGIYLSSGSIKGCCAKNNGTFGIWLHTGVMSGCSAVVTSGYGIVADMSAHISGCESRINSGGISVGTGCVVTNNVCDSNTSAGVAGILCTGSRNRVEGNTLHSNAIGLSVTAAGNVIVRNACTANTAGNWSIVAGNAVAPIVSVSTNSTAISGNVYAGSIGTTDPNANFTY